MELGLWLLAGLPLLLGFDSMGQHKTWTDSRRWECYKKASERCDRCKLNYRVCPTYKKIYDTLEPPTAKECEKELQELEEARQALKSYLDERAEKAGDSDGLEKVEMGKCCVTLPGWTGSPSFLFYQLLRFLPVVEPKT